MNLDLDTGKLVVFLGGLLLFLGLESLWPARPWRMSRWHRLGFHAAIAVTNTLVLRLVVYVPLLLWAVHVEEEGYGVARWLGIEGWLEIVAAVLVIDAFDYLWHRANHRVNWLWRFHKAHHADSGMDLSTALRFHPGELLLSGVAKAIWIGVWGPTVVAWFLFEALVSFCAQFHHSNIDFPDRIERVLSWFIVTSRFHAAHHAVDRAFGDRNFSTIFSVWDRLFGSYARPADGGATTNAAQALGLPDARELAFSPVAWLMEPFASRNLRPAETSPAAMPGID